MTKKEFFDLTAIARIEDIPAGAAYYSTMYDRALCRIMYSLYDCNFKFIALVAIRYTNVLKDLERVVPESNKDDMALCAYHLIDLKNGFYKIEEDKETLEGLRAICKSVSK